MENIYKSQYDFMLEQNKNYMNYIALSTMDGRKITYEELHDRIEKYVKLLYFKGVREGDKIGICALNTCESVYLLYALEILGATVVGFNPFDKKEKVKKDIELTRPKMVISVDAFYSNFKSYEKALDFSTILYSPFDNMGISKTKIKYDIFKTLKGGFTLDRNNKLGYLINQEYNDEPERAEFKEGSTKNILFTGGSTGIHKGVDLSAEGMNSVVVGMNSIFKATSGMIHLGNIPFGHMAYGRSILHFSLCNNMEYALTLKAMPKDFYPELVRTRANAAVGGPPHWVSLIEETPDGFKPRENLVKDSLPFLEYATSGGEAKKQSTVDAINAALHYCGSNAELGDGLGATETNASMMINNPKIHSGKSVGKPISTIEVKLVDQVTGLEVEKGKSGLLYVSGPSVMIGYHNNQEETDKVISYDENGKKWINIGDILKECENGEYQYIGRQKRNFVSGCDNIYPEELEDLLVSIPEIREAVVTPISDPLVQYIPRYHISLSSPDIDRKTLEQKINELVMKKLNENWLPGSIAYYDKPLERMSNSKIDISYYKDLDNKAVEEGLINNCDAKELRLKKY